MIQQNSVIKLVIRYSEAFKMAVVGELESQGVTIIAVRRKYGIRGAGTVESWLGKYGNGTRGKMIFVQKPEEINELKRLKERMRRLETALADANVELVLERAYLRMACERAGITDVGEFKKKAGGEQRMRV
jgi:transposase-like protein